MNHNIPDGPKLNLGCGPVQPAGWVNVDGSNRAWLASRFNWLDNLLVRLKVLRPTEFNRQTRILNLFKPLPYADGTVSAIYAGELWEHFEYPDGERLTTECFRVLAPGGVLRVTVPDGIEFWKRYIQLFDENMSRPADQRDGAPLRKIVGMYFNDICTRRIWLGSMGHTHKWQYDEIQLVELFRSRGFVDVARRSFRDSRIPGIDGVERSPFLTVEGVKP